MPYRSKAQQGYLHAKLPAVAKKFDAETPKGMYVKLPKKVGTPKKTKPKMGY